MSSTAFSDCAMGYDPATESYLMTEADSETAVALFGKDVYVLEYLHTAVEDRRQWVPRIRRITPDGSDRHRPSGRQTNPTPRKKSGAVSPIPAAAWASSCRRGNG